MLKNNTLKSFFLFFMTLLALHTGHAQSPETIKEGVYKAMAGNDLALVNAVLQNIEKLAPGEINGYRGALLMKKAGLLNPPGEKLSTFKEGKEILEKAIAADTDNPEFRFLRIMIQENAPKILGYDKNLSEDAEVVQASFNEFSLEVKAAVVNYSSNSTILDIKG